ncbi:uncharacterized protein LOC111103902 isoform X3 [Crassostrea virginica]
MASFVGRLSEIRELRENVQQHEIVVIRGFKGVGKSSIARELCRQIQQPYYWNDLRNINTADGVLQHLLSNFTQEAAVLEDKRALLTIVCENIASQGCDLVVIFDNAEDVIKGEDSAFFVDIILSLSHLINTNILVTTNVMLPFHQDKICDFILKELCFKDSYDLLKSVCPTLKDTDKISAIVNLCEGIPLALVLAGGEIGFLNVDEVIYLLSHRRLKVLSSDCYSKDEQLEPVYKGFLDRLPTVLEDKLAVLNYIPGTFNKEEAISVLGVRARFCKTFAVILKQIEKKTETKDYAEALSRVSVEYQNFRKLFTDVIHCTEDTYHVFIDLAATSFTGESILFTTMANYDMGIHFYKVCLRKTVEYKEELDEAKVLTGYGKVLTNIKGDYVRAEERFQRAMDIRRRHSKKRDYFMALLCQSYGWNLGCQGKFVQASRILEEAYELERELKMHYEKLMLQTMQSLAIFYNMSGRTDKGEQLQKEVLKRRLHIIGTENHPIIGSIMNNMGILYEKKEDFAKAAYYYRKGLEIKENTNAPIKAILVSENNVARSLLEVNQYEEAIGLLRNSFERLKDFPDLFLDARSVLWETMGKALLKMNNPPEASVALRNAIAFRTRSSASDHTILGLVCIYAQNLLAMSQYEKAVTELLKGLRMRNSIIKIVPTNSSITLAYEKLLEAYFALERKEDMKSAFEAGKDEFLRLMKVYEDLKDFNKREEVLSHFKRFEQRYLEMIKHLQIHDPHECSHNDNLEYIFVVGCKLICVAILLFYINRQMRK